MAPAIALVALVLLAACARRPPVVLPSQYQQTHVTFFVAHSDGDATAMEEDIAAELRRRGFNASAGPYENLPADTLVLVLYRDSWWMNILAQGEILVLELRDGRNGATLASAEQRWISHVGDSPDTLIADAVTQVLGNAAGLSPQAAEVAQ